MGAIQGGTERVGGRLLAPSRIYSGSARYLVLGLPLAFVVVLFVVPLALTVLWSFWARSGVWIQPAFTTEAYVTFFSGERLSVLRRSLVVAAVSTAIGLVLAYPIAYLLSTRVRVELRQAFLLLFVVPFVINPIIRTISWVYLLGRTGPVNRSLIRAGVVDRPVDWLLYSDFAVYVGLLTSYMPFMIFPVWLALSGIDRRLIEASWLLGADPRTTFRRITLPLSLPGIFAASIFGFVGAFGESAVPIILGGVGYQLMGNTITSALDVLNYPLAAAMSSVVVALMLALIVAWFIAFDLRSLLGKITLWRV